MKLAFFLLLLPTLIFANGADAIQVITSDFREGAVVGSFGTNDNMIIVRDSDWNNLTYSQDQLAATKGCVGAICVGDKVLSDSFEKVVVKGIFPSGKVVVKGVDTYAFKAVWPEDLAITTGCSFKFCMGDRVVFPHSTDSKSLKIIGFLANKRIVVKDELGAMIVNQNEVVATEDLCRK